MGDPCFKKQSDELVGCLSVVFPELSLLMNVVDGARIVVMAYRSGQGVSFRTAAAYSGDVIVGIVLGPYWDGVKCIKGLPDLLCNPLDLTPMMRRRGTMSEVAINGALHRRQVSARPRACALLRIMRARAAAHNDGQRRAALCGAGRHDAPRRLAISRDGSTLAASCSHSRTRARPVALRAVRDYLLLVLGDEQLLAVDERGVADRQQWVRVRRVRTVRALS